MGSPAGPVLCLSQTSGPHKESGSRKREEKEEEDEKEEQGERVRRRREKRREERRKEEEEKKREEERKRSIRSAGSVYHPRWPVLHGGPLQTPPQLFRQTGLGQRLL